MGLLSIPVLLTRCRSPLPFCFSRVLIFAAPVFIWHFDQEMRGPEPTRLANVNTMERNASKRMSTAQTRLLKEVETAIAGGTKKVSAGGDGQVDLAPLLEIEDIEELELSFGDLKEYSPLTNLKNLRRLVLQSDCHSDISPLSKLSRLEELELIDGQIDDLAPLSNLTRLRRLSLSWCSLLDDIEPISRLESISDLEFYSCGKLFDLYPLRNCLALESLSITDCFEVNDVSDLADLPHLIKLVLKHTGVEDVTELEGKEGLELVFEPFPFE